MNDTVVWRPTSEARLAVLWLAAPDRDAVTSAADSIDAMLRADPKAVGESRDDPGRMLIVPPPAINYDVHDEDRIVADWAVWRCTPTP